MYSEEADITPDTKAPPIAIKKLEEKNSWGMLKQDFPETIATVKDVNEKAPEFSTAAYVNCVRRLHETSAYPYGDDAATYFGSTTALVGKNKEIIAIPMAEEEASIIFVTAKNGIFSVELNNLREDGRYLPDKWKTNSVKDRPMIIKVDDILYVGNELDLHRENIGVKLKHRNVATSTSPLTALNVQHIYKYTTYYLDEYLKHFQQKLNSSRMHSQYDYHGLMELSALAQCLNELGENKILRPQIEAVMDKITPNWKKNMGKKAPKQGQE